MKEVYSFSLENPGNIFCPWFLDDRTKGNKTSLSVSVTLDIASPSSILTTRRGLLVLLWESSNEEKCHESHSFLKTGICDEDTWFSELSFKSKIPHWRLFCAMSSTSPSSLYYYSY